MDTEKALEELDCEGLTLDQRIVLWYLRGGDPGNEPPLEVTGEGVETIESSEDFPKPPNDKLQVENFGEPREVRLKRIKRDVSLSSDTSVKSILSKLYSKSCRLVKIELERDKAPVGMSIYKLTELGVAVVDSHLEKIRTAKKGEKVELKEEKVKKALN